MDHDISFQAVSKCYMLRTKKQYLVHDLARKVLKRRKRVEPFWALRDVSFNVRSGEAVAFVGGNGAGKSTVLSLVAGTVFPTSGHIHVRGRIGALLELGAGFHPDMTGRENIYLNASLLGMSQDQIDEHYEAIIAFSELGQFIDAPLRTYSSGMQVRLGFSVAIHIDPDVLIMDEVLAVGDQHFQKKCQRRIDALREQNKTLLFVSHSPDAVRQICRRVIWLDQGRLVADGDVDVILPEYEKFITAAG